MKKIVALLFVALMVVSCSSSNQGSQVKPIVLSKSMEEIVSLFNPSAFLAFEIIKKEDLEKHVEIIAQHYYQGKVIEEQEMLRVYPKDEKTIRVLLATQIQDNTVNIYSQSDTGGGLEFQIDLKSNKRDDQSSFTRISEMKLEEDINEPILFITHDQKSEQASTDNPKDYNEAIIIYLKVS